MLCYKLSKKDGSCGLRYSVDMDAVYKAIEYLKQNNSLYRDVRVNSRSVSDAEFPPVEEDGVVIDVVDSVALIDLSGNFNYNKNYFGVPRTLEQSGQGMVFGIDENREEVQYPHLFPLGKHGDGFRGRPVKLSLSEIYKLRI